MIQYHGKFSTNSHCLAKRTQNAWHLLRNWLLGAKSRQNFCAAERRVRRTGEVKYWIQRADFEASEGATSSAGEAIRIFEAQDWPKELNYQAEMEAAGSDCCPPGFGLVADDGRILHLCPEPGGPLLCHYHFPEEYRLFGLFRRRRQATLSWGHTGTASELVDSFFENRHDVLARYAHGPF